MGVRFRRDSEEESCDKSIRMTFDRGRIVCGCLRTKGHKGKCVAMAYDAAKADGVCAWCREHVGSPHRPDCTSGEYMVECAFCCARFGQATNTVSYMHGAGCSARIFQHPFDGRYVVLPHYGSAYDYMVFPFKDGAPVGFEDTVPVCDGCIRGFIEQGALENIEAVQ